MSEKTESINKLNSISPFGNVLLNLMYIIISIVCIGPILLVLSISFSSEESIRLNGYSFIPQQFTLEAYNFVMKGGDAIWSAYGISIFVTIVGTLLSMVCICLYAYPLSRQNFRHKSLFSFLAYFTMIFGGGLVPWYMVYTNLFPINNSIWILIFPYLMNAWYVIIMRTFYMTTVPESLLEAARIDGAGEFRTFFQIVAPLSKAGLATIGLFSTLVYWNDWYLPLMFVTERKFFNIQYLMYQTLVSIQYLTSGSANLANLAELLANMPSESARMAIAVLSIGPIVLAYPFFQGYFVKGLTVGAVKG